VWRSDPVSIPINVCEEEEDLLVCNNTIEGQVCGARTLCSSEVRGGVVLRLCFSFFRTLCQVCGDPCVACALSRYRVLVSSCRQKRPTSVKRDLLVIVKRDLLVIVPCRYRVLSDPVKRVY
jgi:hypothetical protein